MRVKKILSKGAAVIAVFIFLMGASNANAASYELRGQNDFQGQDVSAIPGIRARVTTIPDGAIKPGDNVRFAIRIFNDNAQTASGINISFIPDSNVAELVASKPLLDFSSGYVNQATGWSNVSIPARSSKDYTITFRVKPNQAASSSLGFTAWVGQGSYQMDRYFSVPISGTQGDQRSVNTNIIDNYFRVAAGRFPNSAERAEWTKKYDEYRANTALHKSRENRIGLFIKAIASKAGKSLPASSSSAAPSSAGGTLASISDLNSMFRSVHGRTPTVSEWTYWAERLLDKSDRVALKGAMYFHKALGRTIGDLPKKTGNSASSSSNVVKFTASDFKLKTPDSLNTDPDDQQVTWYSSSAVKDKYPNLKIELCPGKDFKGCVIVNAVTENDGVEAISMPPVPRIGKWYLRLIGRDANNGLRPELQALKLVRLHK